MSLVFEDISNRLDQVDWNFSGSSSLKSSLHSLHWFPGNFIPQIPSYLIQILSKPGDIVLDPFCGSGTTGIEAVILNRRSWQSDLNPVAIRVTRGKISAAGIGIADELIEIGRSLFFISANVEPPEGTAGDLEEWFHKDTLAQLRFLWKIVFSQSKTEVRDVLEMLFTDVLFSCGSAGAVETSTGGRRRHHWGWIADNVKPPKLVWHNAIDMFRDRIFRAVEVIHSQSLPQALNCDLRHEDARHTSFPSDGADLVVTSPPYLGMIDYTLSNRLTYLWYGWNMREDQKQEIGARRRRDQMTATSDYLGSMSLVATEITRILRPGGHCAIVIGASQKYPHVALNVLDIFSGCLSRIHDPIPRVLSRRRLSSRGGPEPTEYICVFQKD